LPQTLLGASQTVGRSCVIVELKNRTVMFDCGENPGFTDERKYPSFNLLVNTQGFASINNLIKKLTRINEIIDCVVVSHFHMDHIGALPFFTEVLNYKGVIIMSYPSKALSPVLLLDACKITDFRWNQNFVDKQIHDIYKCMNKIVGLQINETHTLGNLSITPYYAGHVLGACMFKIEVNGFSVLYTGDFNTVPDKHLGSAKIPSLKPDVLISESTYATYVRPTKKSSELELCNYVHECMHNGGKVLIPVFAIGRKIGMQKLSKYIHNQYNINSICPTLGKKHEFSFCKYNIQYIYIHNEIFKVIQKKLQEKKQEMIGLKKNQILYVKI
uniref:Metallo-beta-lactamase domain-containing protein n=1 Tax=Piliocolobus tephrosceles TaxID=591936 RepID=A0A8C9GBU0_9PRIM